MISLTRSNRSGMPTWITSAMFFCIGFAVNSVDAFDLVIAGPGALEVKLIAGKLAERSGDRCSIISPDDKGFLKKCRALMYGQGDNDKGPEGPTFVSSGEDIGSALKTAKGLIITCDDKAMEDRMINTILTNAPELQHVSFLSKMGGRLRKAEESLKKRCAEDNIAVSIIRAGVLKGGGPGGEEGVELGLSKHFDATIFDLLEAQTSKSFDKFTLGAKVTPGDPFKGYSSLFASQSFKASDTTTGRTNAAQALLLAVKKEKGIDISLSSEKGEKVPTEEEWANMLSL